MADPGEPVCGSAAADDISSGTNEMEESMFCESSMLPRNKIADHKWADESGEQIGTVEKLVLALVSVVVAGATLFLPVALLHVK